MKIRRRGCLVGKPTFHVCSSLVSSSPLMGWKKWCVKRWWHRIKCDRHWQAKQRNFLDRPFVKRPSLAACIFMRLSVHTPLILTAHPTYLFCHSVSISPTSVPNVCILSVQAHVWMVSNMRTQLDTQVLKNDLLPVSIFVQILDTSIRPIINLISFFHFLITINLCNI